jgi:hypothetical protein
MDDLCKGRSRDHAKTSPMELLAMTKRVVAVFSQAAEIGLFVVAAAMLVVGTIGLR